MVVISVPRPWWEGLGEGVNCYNITSIGCLRQRLLKLPSRKRGWGVLRQIYTPLYRSTERSRRSLLFLEGNYKSLKFLCIKLRERITNMEEKKKIIVVARTEGIEIIVEGEKDTDDYELLLSKTQAMELAMSILNTLYKTGIKM